MSIYHPSASALTDLGALVSGRLPPADVPVECWSALVEAAVQHGLGPMLAWTLEQEHFALVEASLYERVRQITRSAVLRRLLVQASLQQLQIAFADAGIHAVWLKGIVLAGTVYPDPWLRPMLDIDVLVPGEQRPRAVCAARKAGFRQADPSASMLPDDLIHHTVLISPVTSSLTVEIHSRLLGIGGRKSLLPPEQLAWFLEPAQVIQTPQGLTTLRPEAHLLYLCAHALLQHSEAQPYLLRFFDMHRLITCTNLDWEIAVGKAYELGWAPAVERALVVTNQYFGTSLPRAHMAELRSAWSSAVRSSAKPLLAINSGTTDWHRTRYWLRQLTLWERIRVIRKMILPSPSYMRRRYAIRGGKKVWLYYAVRWLSQGRKVADAIRATPRGR